MSFITVFVLGTLAVSLIPPTYRSLVKIMFVQNEMPEPLLDTTVGGSTEERVKILFTQLTTSEKIKYYVVEHKLKTTALDALEEEEIDSITEDLRGKLSFRFYEELLGREAWGREIFKTTGFVIGVDGPDPDLTVGVINALGIDMVLENQESRIQEAQSALNFVLSQEAFYKSKTKDLETQIAGLEQSNYDILPKQNLANRNKLLKLRERVNFLNNTIELEESLLNQTNRQLDLFPSDANANQVTAYLQRLLSDYTTQLTMLKESVKSDHPDIVNLKENILELETQLKSGNAIPNAAILKDSIFYKRLIDKKDRLASEIERRKLLLSEANREMSETSSILRNAENSIERKYNDLVLDQHIVRKELDELRRKIYHARVALALEKSGKAGGLDLISQAAKPKNSIYPNKLGYYIFIVYVALLASWLSLRIKAPRNTMINTSKDLESIVGSNMIYTIPTIG
ncbi:GumC domain-containing protein [Ketobacter sp.]